MINFSANLSMLFAEVDFLERFERAAAAGFKAVEFSFPNLFKFIEQSGYDGWVGCEYIPDGRTEDTLEFLTFNQ